MLENHKNRWKGEQVVAFETHFFKHSIAENPQYYT